jgi:hypothetical protein
MSLATLTNRVQYTANGVNTIFAFPYKFFQDTDLEVYVGTSLKTLTTDYTVTGIPPGSFASGGNIVFGTAPANLSVVTIVRKVPRVQSSDYQDYPNYAAAANVFENDLDRRAMCEQELADEISRILKIPVTDPIGLDMTLPTQLARMNTFFAFDADGKPIAAAGMASVPVTGFMATLLDDADAAAGRATLGAQVLLSSLDEPCILAASDSPADWKSIAQHVFTASEDAGAYINTLSSAGVKQIFMTPGKFRISTTISPGASAVLDIRCAGSCLTTWDLNATALTVVSLPNAYTGKFGLGGVTVDASGIYVAAEMDLLYGRQASISVNNYDQQWDDVVILINNLTFAGGTSPLHCFDSIWNATRCKVKVTAQGNPGNAQFITGFNNGLNLSECHVILGAGYSTLSYIGFSAAYFLTRCSYVGIASSSAGSMGFFSCGRMAACRASYSKGDGFNSCENLSDCEANNNTGDGFSTCNYIAACRSQSNGGSGFFTCQHVIGCRSNNNTGSGFSTSKQCQQNYAYSNTANQYGTAGTQSYADQSTAACANTSAGGFNR